MTTDMMSLMCWLVEIESIWPTAILTFGMKDSTLYFWFLITLGGYSVSDSDRWWRGSRPILTVLGWRIFCRRHFPHNESQHLQGHNEQSIIENTWLYGWLSYKPVHLNIGSFQSDVKQSTSDCHLERGRLVSVCESKSWSKDSVILSSSVSILNWLAGAPYLKDQTIPHMLAVKYAYDSAGFSHQTINKL